jgi:hypothetical protein
MWHAPNQRVRAVASSKKRERDRARKPIHIKRIIAHIDVITPTGVPPVQTDVRLILNDLSPKGVGVFSSIPLVAGQETSLTISDPIQLKVKARVAWCQEHAANSHILSNQPFSYRLGLEFIMTAEEEPVVKAFFEEISKTHLYAKAA